jgi:hypothetical protein
MQTGLRMNQFVMMNIAVMLNYRYVSRNKNLIHEKNKAKLTSCNRPGHI